MSNVATKGVHQAPDQGAAYVVSFENLRMGAGVAIVGDPDQVGGTLRELAHAGVRAFILSGYPHAAECDLVARYVLPRLAHAPLALTPSPAARP